MSSAELLNVKVDVGRVKIEGLKRTKSDIIAEQIKGIFTAKNLLELLAKIDEASTNLNELNIFKSVSILLDTDKRSLYGGGGRDKRSGGSARGDEKVEVTFLVEESSWCKTAFGAEAGTQSGGANFDVTLRNLFGRAEQLQLASVATFPHWGHSLQLQFSKPYYRDILKKGVLSVGTTDNKVPVCGYEEHITGGSVEAYFPSSLGLHNLSLNCHCRHIGSFSHNIPMSIREQAGYSLKSSIKHILDFERRDNPLFPRNGYRIKVTNEMAGLGGDVHFSKVEMQSEYLKEFYNNWVLSLTLWGGCLNPFSPSHINDRFLLGGTSSLRGFGMWGAGPRELGFTLGGEAYWASGLHLFTPLPLVRNEGLFGLFRLHAFATMGNMVGKVTFSPSTLKSLLASNVRVSCGFGLHVRLSWVQIEFNYAVPIKAHSNDQLHPGLQFGIGVDML